MRAKHNPNPNIGSRLRSSVAKLATAATLAILGVAGSALASGAGCTAKNRRTPDDTLVVLIPNLIKDLDPRFQIKSFDEKLSRLVAPGLTTIDRQDLEPALFLAESIELESPTRVRVRIRPDATFSDGSPVLAEDVAFTFESAMLEELNAVPGSGFRERFKSFTVVGDRELVIELQKVVATLRSDLDFGIVKKGATNDKMLFEGGVVIGAGPYRIVKLGGEELLLERNPHYFGNALGDGARIGKIKVKVIRDSNARTLMLVGGSADITQNGIRVDLVDEVVKRERLHMVSAPSSILSYLMMHNRDPVLSDARVRRAIGFALNREAIIDAKMGGRAVLATGLLPPSHWAYNGKVDRYSYDPERAKALLDEAGYPDPDGDGPKPRMKLSYKTSADQFRLTIARIIASQLADVGIEIDVRSFEFGTFFADVKAGNYQLASMQTGSITEPDYYFTYFHSSRIPTEKRKHIHNRWRFTNARVDELTIAGRAEPDRDNRRLLYGEVQEILARELPIVPLWHEDNIALMNTDVNEYPLFPNGRFAGLAVATKSRSE